MCIKYARKLALFYVVVACTSTGVKDRDAEATEGQGGSTRVDGNGNVQKAKKSLPLMFVSVDQKC